MRIHFSASVTLNPFIYNDKLKNLARDSVLGFVTVDRGEIYIQRLRGPLSRSHARPIMKLLDPLKRATRAQIRIFFLFA